MQVSIQRLARHEARRRHAFAPAERSGGPTQSADTTADEVLGNVDAMDVAVNTVSTASVVSVQHVLQIHEALMRHSAHPDSAVACVRRRTG